MAGSPDHMYKGAEPAAAVAAKALRAVEAGRRLKCSRLGEMLLSQTSRFTPRRWVVGITARMMRA